MKNTVIVWLLPAVLFAANFSDNFDSYTVGDDLGDSIYWLKIDPGGSLIATESGGSGIVESQWDGQNYIGYACVGALVCSDVEISTKAVLNGSEAIAGLIVRVNPLSGECYIGGIYRVYGTVGATVIAYVNSSGESSILSNDFFYPLNENTWYDLAFEATGSSPVNLQFSVNGVIKSEVQETEHNIGTGLTGIGGTYESSPPVIRIDDFCVVDYNAALNRTSFGAIKATFL